MDGGRRLVFRRNNLPIHHLVVQRHHGEVQIRILAGELLQGGVKPSSENLGGAQLEFFNLLLEPLILLLQFFSSLPSLKKVLSNLLVLRLRLDQLCGDLPIFLFGLGEFGHGVVSLLFNFPQEDLPIC